jgi:predicted O-linked N-acetylglucosamine transferase (SPINDLY family)
MGKSAEGKGPFAAGHEGLAAAMNPVQDQLRLAIEHHERGQLADAERIYRAILKADPNHAEVHQRLGLIAATVRKPDAAEKMFQRAIALAPSVGEYHVSLGMILRQQGRRDASIASFDRAFALRPTDLHSLVLLGGVLKDIGRIDNAIRCCEWMIEINPSWAPAHANRGIALAELRRYDEAIEALNRAIALEPNYLEAINALGLVLTERGKCDEAIALHSRAAALQPQTPQHIGNIGGVLITQGKIHEAIAFHRNAIARGIRHPALDDNLLYALNFDERATPLEIADAHRQWAALFERPLLNRSIAHHNVRDPNRKLRIAYHGMFDRLNPIGMLLQRALCAHDRESVELFLYHESTRTLPAAEWTKTCADYVCHTLGLADDAFAEMVRLDKIDVMVDLCGHTAHNRLLTFARRPAPVQMTYLGYCNTTGMESMDYMITDAIVDPPEFETRYTETLIRLPGGFTSFSPPEDAPIPNPLPAIKGGVVTFGSTHALAKINHSMVRLWAKLLREIPNARLLIVRHTLNGSALDHLRAWIDEEKIDPSRVELRSEIPTQGHYWLYHEIDILLDTQPWSGHVTACQSMWMGVPIVTMLGGTRAGRMVASVLHQVRRTDWIANDENEYIEILKRLASDVPALAAVRATLRDQIAESPLCDGGRLAMELEQRYRVAWRRWCKSGK